jgi:hypothetical protein
MHDLPLVPALRLKVQKRRARVLQLNKELKRVSSTSYLPRRGGLGSDPSIPLLDNQRPCFSLLQSTRCLVEVPLTPPVSGCEVRLRFGRLFVYVNTSKQVGDADHLKVFANLDAAETWFEENDPGVGRRTIMCMLLVAARAVIWNLLGR